MSSSLTLIAGGSLYDPAHGIDGQIQDVWFADGKIVAPPTDRASQPGRTIDATGLVIMPGGVDMHCHIAGSKANAARLLVPETRRPPAVMPQTDLCRSGTLGSVPSTFATAYKYAGLGYTTAFDAAIPPLAARHAHHEFDDTPCLDKGFFVLVGNNHYVLQAIQQQEPERLQMFLAWLLGAARAYAPKIVNPGGVEVWKQSAAGGAQDFDQQVPGFGVTPRQIVRELVHAANALDLPHPAHIHCNQLGMPGNWSTTLETMRAIEGERAHLTHIQFHSYGGGEADEGTFCSQVEPLAEYVNTHANLTVDVGQVLFGHTMAMTGDGAAGYFLHRLYGDRWYNCDVEMEAGCGITPIEYRRKSLIHALQWAIGLEWYLMVRDPWQVMMSTDHPNGGSFLAYPQIIHLLMDRTFRQEVLKTCPAEVLNRTQLGQLDREYTLSEIAIITRAGPARALGLKDKGHLGPGADADITLYTPSTNRQTMFELPRLVIKGGEVLVEQGEIRSTPKGRTLHVAPTYDAAILSHIRPWFEQHYSIQFANYAMEWEP